MKAKILLLFAAIIATGLPFGAQSSSPRIQGDLDRDLPVPEASQKEFGYIDALALPELIAYKQAIRATGWKGFEAKGSIFFNSDSNSKPIDLVIQPDNKVKLDVTTDKGHDITVYNGTRGGSLSGAKKTFFAPLGATSGLAPFDLPLIVDSIKKRDACVVDKGQVSIDGQSYHRITVEKALSQRDRYPYQKEDRTVVDLYFNPTSHLLMKTAVLIPVPGTSIPALLKVNTYSQYKELGPHTLPSVIEESVNGQLIWKISIASIDTSKTFSGKDFQF